MLRASLSCVLAGVLLVVAGCQKSDEPPKQAVTAKGGLMPVSTSEPRVPVSAVADQKQVKMIERTVSYEPLDTFVAKNAAAQEKAADAGKKKTASEDKEGGKAKGDKVAAKSGEKKPAGKKGLFGRLKSELGAKVGGLTQLGGAALGGPGLPPPDAAGKGSEKKGDAKAKKGEGEEEGDEKAAAGDDKDKDKEDEAKDADEEESDEDSADEDESDDDSDDAAEEDDSKDDEDDSDKEGEDDSDKDDDE